MQREEIVATYWRDCIRWSDAAGRLQRDVKRWRRVQLVLAVIGAALATAAATPEIANSVRTLLGIAGAVALCLVPATARYFLSKETVDRWPRARSVSEGLKSEVFRFQAAAGPYADDGDGGGGTALQRFVERANEIVALGADIEAYVPAEPSRDEPPPGPQTPASYLTDRVNEQIEDYYRKRSRENLDLANRYRRLSVAFLIAAAVISALTAGGWWPSLGAWVAVATTIGTAFATHSAVNRYEILAVSYAKQASELRRLALAWQAKPDRDSPAAWSAFVMACESAISAENRAWMARMMEDVQGIEDVIRNVSAGRS